MIETKVSNDIAKQLTDIYELDEVWHTNKMTHDEAIKYHQECLNNGNIVVYLKDGIVVGYYERYIIGRTCVLYNVFIKPDYRRGFVWKELYRHFFNTMPKHISKVIGEKQKIDGKLVSKFITKGRINKEVVQHGVN